jgi:hypothetical protein
MPKATIESEVLKRRYVIVCPRGTEGEVQLHKITFRLLTSSIERDFEDHDGDGVHGGFIVLLPALWLVVIILAWRACA